jgi:predicted lysophospholipase L1 biosynthesis ABC-type transport system permease subunit
MAFGLWPLGRVHDVPVAALFREIVASAWQWHKSHPHGYGQP